MVKTGRVALKVPKSTRRAVLKAACAGLAMPFVWRAGLAQTRPRVAIIGGGAAGATAARTLARESSGAIDITVIEANAAHFPAHALNRVMAGIDDAQSATIGYQTFATNYGITIIHDRAVEIDQEKSRVILETAPVVPYDRLIVAPGIQYDLSSIQVEGEETDLINSANWMSQPPQRTIAEEVERLNDGDSFLMVPAPRPSRFPLGAYERVSLLADALTTAQKSARILVLDEFGDIDLQPLFLEAWKSRYPGMIELVSLSETGPIISANMTTVEIQTASGLEFTASSGCYIPAQKAGELALAMGLTDEGGWCPVDPTSFRSRKNPHIHVIGDAANAAAMPKTASSAASQADTAARFVLSDLIAQVTQKPVLRSRSWPMTSGTTALREDQTFEATNEGLTAIASNLSRQDDTEHDRAQNAKLSTLWHATFKNRMVGI